MNIDIGICLQQRHHLTHDEHQPTLNTISIITAKQKPQICLNYSVYLLARVYQVIPTSLQIQALVLSSLKLLTGDNTSFVMPRLPE